MTLRAKTLLFIIATLLVLIVAFYLIASSIWLDNFAQLENRAVRTNVSRLVTAHAARAAQHRMRSTRANNAHQTRVARGRATLV